MHDGIRMYSYLLNRAGELFAGLPLRVARILRLRIFAIQGTYTSTTTCMNLTWEKCDICIYTNSRQLFIMYTHAHALSSSNEWFYTWTLPLPLYIIIYNFWVTGQLLLCVVEFSSMFRRLLCGLLLRVWLVHSHAIRLLCRLLLSANGHVDRNSRRRLLGGLLLPCGVL